MYQLENEEGTLVTDLSTGAVGIHPGIWLWAEYQKWLDKGNIPKPMQPGPFYTFDKDTWTWVKNEVSEKAAARAAMICSPLQIRRALRRSSLLAAVKTWLQTADEETAEDWEYATVFNRTDTVITKMKQALDKNNGDIDDIFTLAMTL